MGEKQKDHLGMMATSTAKVVFQVQWQKQSQGKSKRRTPDAHSGLHTRLYIQTHAHTNKQESCLCGPYSNNLIQFKDRTAVPL